MRVQSAAIASLTVLLTPTVSLACSPLEWALYFESGSLKTRKELPFDETTAAFAQWASHPETTRVLIVGHADTSGSERANQRLSKQRAELVAARLRSLGLRSELITVKWRGEAHLAVPTPDNVDEVLNSRVNLYADAPIGCPEPDPRPHEDRPEPNVP